MDTNRLPLDLALPITTWIHDETLYSLCCRFHYVFGNALDSQTTRQLFDHSRHGSQHDFPSRINVFIERTNGIFGDNAKALIYEHTILRFYLPWRLEQQAQAIVREMCAGNASKIKSRLGLLASRMRAHHPLKACPACMQVDKQQFGVSYWHLSHQLPGVWLCPIHTCALQVSAMKSNGVGRFLWCLPHDGSFYAQAPGLSDKPTIKTLEGLATIAAAIFDLPPDTCIDPAKLASAYHVALEHRALLRGQMQVALTETAEQYLQFTKRLDFTGLDIQLPANHSQAMIQLTKLLACPTRPTHPLRHMLLILWLFERWECFWDVYLKAAPCSKNTSESEPTAMPHTDPRISTLLLLVQNQGMAVSTAARQIGIAIQTAQNWVSIYGVPVYRRPKTPSHKITSIRDDLRKGKDKAEIAERHQVSTQTVCRLLKTDPILFARWKKQQQERRLLAARRLWKATIKRNPRLILKELRAREPGTYVWLYRHDRDWLTQSVESLPKYQHTPAGVDWYQRDAQLMDLISDAVRALQAKGVSRITLQTLYQHEPSFKPFLNKLNRLPRTRLLLEQILRRSSHQPTTDC